ncbi:MAG TPA: TetR/AcrR family transcriptional regulator [Thermoanaerobaculia bacterium]|jgi:AcrR family transcriptional regulator|nr:TetR/AcrR family transcriptional regulator [Thermoanaerobaculia bacterium]
MTLQTPQRRTKRDVLTEFRHAEILAAARGVFAEKGFAGASVDDIAQAAGVAKGTIYLYYPSKREIYFAALREGLTALAVKTEARVAGAETLYDQIRAYVETKLRYFDENRDFFKIYFAELGNMVTQHETRDSGFEQIYLDQVALLENAVRQGGGRGETRDLPARSVAFAIANLTRGAVTQRLVGWTEGSIEREVELLVDLAWKGISSQ